TYMEEFDYLFSKIGLNMHIMKPQTMLQLINSVDKICKHKVFANGNIIQDNDLVITVAASLLVAPFLTSESTMEDAVRTAQILQLETFFGAPSAIISRCAIIISPRERSMEELLEDRTFLDLIGHNEYQGIRWFRGESFQECMYLVYLSNALKSTKVMTEKRELEIRKEIDMWLRRCADANYRMDNLLKG
ncbi:MAG: hypothetical protein IJ863_03180, partial [Spirochaetales bacterium]|nr:hypothetical protein [Spirochaetales bacterium]